MQLMAANMSKIIDDQKFFGILVAPFMVDAKTALMVYAKSGEMAHPHYPQSYYLLSDKYS
jgi:hypothetical protein